MKPARAGREGRQPWLVFGAAGVAGFIAQGTFANSVLALAIFLLSLFIAAFLVALGHSVLTEQGTEPEREPEEAPSSPEGLRIR